jgi:beta-lactamase class A
LLLAALPAAQAAMDSNANTDDHSINVPTGWWTYQNLTPSQLSTKLNDLNARVVDIEVSSVSSGVPKMAVRLVSNSGAYAVPGATFTWDKTQSQLESLLNSAGGRLIELERYEAGRGNVRYAAAYVPNTGTTARAWGWLPGRTKSEIQSWASANNQRVIDLDTYGSGSSRRWNAVLVANTGSDYKRWDWDVNQTLSQVVSRLGNFQGRLVKIERQSDGKYSFVQVDNTGSNGSAWWHGYGFSSLTEVNNFASQMGARPVDIVPYSASGKTYYDAVVIDNANAATRAVRGKFFEEFLDANGWPVGIFEAYLKRIDTNETVVNLNASRPAETASALKALHLLHAMKGVNAGESLSSNFTYYNYPTDGEADDACPNPAYENASFDVVTTFENGLDLMMNNSDNRTTRGVVLRYGGFSPLNATADAAGLKNTELRHNIGCAYWDLLAEEYRPSTLRNDTTAADLAAIWMGVQKGTLLPSSSRGRTEFLESGNPKTGANENLQAIINQEAKALGISPSEALRFGGRVKTWGKSGGYGTCLPAASDAAVCGQMVSISSSAGLLALPNSGGDFYALRYYGYGSLMSDVPVTSWTGSQAQAYADAWRAAHYEMFRSAVRTALLDW